MRTLALALMAGLTATSAYAADVAMEEPPAPAVVVEEVPIFSWTGGYIGIQGGALWSHNSFTEDDFGVFSDNFNGGLLGGYAGYNWQSGSAGCSAWKATSTGSGTTKRSTSMA